MSGWIFGGAQYLLASDGLSGAVRWMKPFLSFLWSAIESLSVFWLSVDIVEFRRAVCSI